MVKKIREFLGQVRQFLANVVLEWVEPYRWQRGISHLVTGDPPIFCAIHYVETPGRVSHPLRHLNPFFRLLRKQPAYFFFMFLWNMERNEPNEKVKRIHEKFARKNPRHRFAYLCNTSAHYRMCQEMGLPSLFCSHNAFIDECLFRPMPEIEKKHDAIYNAQLSAFKRHFLAEKVASLALITYLYQPEKHQDYITETRTKLSHAIWLNGPFAPETSGAKDRTLKAHEIVVCLNQARVGLCLSAVEGGMFASMEYLLCGLPVVSTRSIGGRDVFFDDDYVKIVEDHPEAVRDGVEEMIRRHIPPDYIRARTLEKVWEHRHRFIEAVQAIYRENGITRDFAAEWPEVFINKMLQWNKDWQPVIKKIRETKRSG